MNELLIRAALVHRSFLQREGELNCGVGKILFRVGRFLQGVGKFLQGVGEFNKGAGKSNFGVGIFKLEVVLKHDLPPTTHFHQRMTHASTSVSDLNCLTRDKSATRG